MYADSSVTIKYRWLYLGLICGVLLLSSRAAWCEAYLARAEGLHTFSRAPLPPTTVLAQLTTAQLEPVQRAFLQTDPEFSP
ncbi:hypothetical protein [Pseudomonas sp. Root569]|uniref:hypothetical protein n=1 Tax=Pseudomonas sp. Root569 TaxID=1736566 RepID=UPI0007031614|nr:hypothetical protein [Pseudomonas sp. Root569]KRA26756.1 hypothetical protein ASD70_18110 [Pseudomonas sp. Root569]